MRREHRPQESGGPAEESALIFSGGGLELALAEREGLPPGSIWEVVLIREGWSKNGVYYTREALAQAVPLFEGSAAQYYAWSGGEAAHLPVYERGESDEGPAGNNVGVYRNVRTREADGRLEVAAEFVVTHPVFAEQMRRYALAGSRAPLGFSIDGRGHLEEGLAEGRRGPIVRTLTAILETTLVSNPAAGGRLDRLVAGLDTTKQKETIMLKQWLRSRRLAQKKSLAGLENLTEAQVLHECIAALREDLGLSAALSLAIEWLGAGKTEEVSQLLQKLVDESGAAAPMEAAPPAAMMESAKLTEASRQLEQARVELCNERLERQLTESKLPDKGAVIVRNQFAGRVHNPEDVAKVVADVREALGTTVEPAGLEQTPRVQIVADKVDKFQAATDIMFGYEWQKDASLTEAQRQIYRDIASDSRQCRPSRLFESWFDQIPGRSGRRAGANALLHEASSSDYSVILGVSSQKRMLQVYDEIPDRSDELVTTVSVDNFKTQTRIVKGGFSDLPTVAEGGTYAQLGTPFEDSLTYALDKKGGLFSITMEMLANDDLRAMRMIPQELARAARHKKKKFIYGLVCGASALTSINADTSWDGTAIYHASHNNTTTSALSESTLFAARQAIRNMRRIAYQLTIGADYSSGATSMTIASYAKLVKGMFFQVGSEIFRVTATPGSSTVSVAGAQFGTTAASHTNGDTLYVLADSIAADRFHVVVPSELEGTLLKVINSELTPGSANNDRNLVNFLGSSFVPHPIDAQYLMADLNNWYVIADQNQVNSIEVGYFNGQTKPEILLANQETVGNTFTADQYDYKIRHIYSGCNVDHYGRYAGIVA
jgi:hypothetical protein